MSILYDANIDCGTTETVTWFASTENRTACCSRYTQSRTFNSIFPMLFQFSCPTWFRFLLIFTSAIWFRSGFFFFSIKMLLQLSCLFTWVSLNVVPTFLYIFLIRALLCVSLHFMNPHFRAKIVVNLLNEDSRSEKKGIRKFVKWRRCGILSRCRKKRSSYYVVTARCH